MAHFIHRLDLPSWMRHFGELAVSRQVLEALSLQLAIIAAMFALAWGIRAATRTWTDRLAERVRGSIRAPRPPDGLRRLVILIYAWLLLVIVEHAAQPVAGGLPLVGVAAALTALWVVLRASTLLMRDALLARVVAAVAWVIAALDILGLLPATTAALGSVAIMVGTVRLSLLLVFKAALIIAVLLWGALALARLVGARIERATGLSPSVQALTVNLIKIVLVALALLIALNMVGIDLTAFAVFSGAIGVGVGFGLQKIVSNFVSGIILLLERSIKPGDIIEVGSTFGSVASLGARYASVRGLDGKEYLIPNENLITNQVVNWSYSSPLVRLAVEFGVAYESDMRLVRELAIKSTLGVARVLATPEPKCHMSGFGDSSVNFVLRFWLSDPANGVINLKGDVFLALWEIFRDNDIELPFPQRDLRLRDIPASLLRAQPPDRSAAG